MGCYSVLNNELVRVSAQLRIDKARECLKDAEIMLAAGSYTTSANRSYYCIFHAMQAVLTTIGFSSKKHSGSIAEFRKSFVKTGAFSEIHSDIIGEAFNVRTKSDYDVHYVIVKTDVEKQVENAKIFLAAVEVYLANL